MNWFRKLLVRLDLYKAVWIVDYDGEENLRLIRWHNSEGIPIVERQGFHIRRIRLQPDGTIQPSCYVKFWKPYKP